MAPSSQGLEPPGIPGRFIGSLQHKVDFVNAVSDQARLNENVVAQLKNNSHQQAVQGDLPAEVQSAVVRVLSDQDDRLQSFREMAAVNGHQK